MHENIKKWLKERLNNEERYIHSIGAEQSARELAKMFGIDEEKAALAALIHDNAKCFSNEEMLKIIEDNNLDISETEKQAYKTLHAGVGAFLAQKELNINDTEILNAIRWHTIGNLNMTKLEKIVYLADKIEPNTREEEFRNKVLNKLKETQNLDEALLICYEATIKSLLDRKMIINIQTIEIWNNLILSLKA